MIIAIDFDGTVVTHSYPVVGRDIGAIPILKQIINAGHKLVLNTMRSGIELYEATLWFEQNQIPLYGVNCNPEQAEWTTSPKVYAQLYIDDAALGCPLKFDPFISGRDFVDWSVVKEALLRMKIIT